jgi:hypothetical protein
MPRAALFALLVASLLTGSLPAQRAGGISHGTAAGVGMHSGFVGPRGSTNGFVPRNGVVRGGFSSRSGFVPRRFHPRPFNNFASVFVPYFDPFEYEGPYPEAETTAPEPPVVQWRTPDTPPAKAQVIEVPGAQNLTAAQTLPPTIFILANGERLEARRFMLTASNLSFSIDRQQRTIPLDMLDLNATIAANRERGIDLRIPADRNEISLSF